MAGEEGIERDVAAALPPQPPPAPAPREAAIAEAMRRFDAGGEATLPERSGRQSATPRRLLRNRPQLAGLVAVSLVLMLGVPIAWRELTSGGSLVTTPDRRYTIDTAVPPSHTAGPREEPRLAQVEAVQPTGASGTSPPNAVAPEALPPPPPAPIDAPAPMAAPVIAAAPAPPSSPVLREERRQAETPGSERMAAAAPPPPQRVVTTAGQASGVQATGDELADVTVTATRARSSRPSYLSTSGDWNACTIDDPRQSLAACRAQINLGARGAKGEAAAFLAEGLTQAWQGDGQRAVAAFDRAIALAPKSSLAWLNRGLARADSGDTAGGAADLDQAARLAPSSARVHYARGRMARDRGDERSARFEFERAAELDRAYAELDE